MKNAIIGLALLGFAFGCRSDRNTSVSDPAEANMPKAECCASKSACSAEAKAKCEAQKAHCTASKTAEQPQN